MLTIYQVDAFTDKIFGGNPAAVCPLKFWLADDVMQSIATENNLAETAFIVPDGKYFKLRWFTPKLEVDLCGHATLAAAHIFFSKLNYQGSVISFNTKSGVLTVEKIAKNRYLMDFPSDHVEIVRDENIKNIVDVGLDLRVLELYKGKDDYLAIINTEKDIINLNPDFKLLSTLPSRGLIVSAKGFQEDFVSRCFFPQSGINEDPTTGSAHTALTPYWAMKLKKNRLQAKQLSERIGQLECIYKGDRTAIIGDAVTYMEGNIEMQSGW